MQCKRVHETARAELFKILGRSQRAISLILLAYLFCPIVVRADVITDLNDKARSHFFASLTGSIPMAYVHAAIYDAVNAIDGRFTVYA